MQEHTIPETLIEQIKAGKAILVVGAGIGTTSWKHLLEQMNRTLAGRGHAGDDVASKDLDKLLAKGSLVRAVGFLARALGEEACDRIVQDAWQTPSELPALPKVIAQLPFRHVWTTFPGDALERAFEDASPSDWPTTRAVGYQALGDLSKRRRTLVKVLGNFDTYVVTPKSVRRALSRAVDLRDYARDFYVEGTLVFVGFRYGDPDFAALLDRVFGMFEPPRSKHYFIGAGVGPVTIDELMAEHHIEVVNLQGKSGDEVAEKAVLDWLEDLRNACGRAGLTLHQGKPDADDIEGWVALLGAAEQAAEARDALDLIAHRARADKKFERVIEVLLGRVEHTDEADERAALLREVAAVYERDLGDAASAFQTLTTACQVDPANDACATDAERLAAATGAWTELVAEASEIAADAKLGPVAAKWWARLGRWYGERLDRADYAVPSLKRALEIDPTHAPAFKSLGEVLRKQQKWAELADTLRAHAEIEGHVATKVDLLLSLGDLSESQLASTGRAIEAYQQAADLDDTSDDALAALERLYRRDERWPNLAKVLERRAEVAEAGSDTGRAAALRRELATLRADKLGDLEGAIARYESALASNGTDVVALKALQELYDKTGRTDDYLRTLERLAQVAPEGERLSTLRKLAAELEDRDGASGRAIRAFEQILDLEPGADDAFRGLGRLHRAGGQWYDAVALIERHIGVAKTPPQKVELFLEAAAIHEKELSDPHRAVEAHLNALAIDEACKPALLALTHLYERTEAWDRAIDVRVKLAGLVPERAAQAYAEAGRLALDKLEESDVALRHFEKALAIDAEHLVALRGVADLYAGRGSWSQAIDHLGRAEAASSNRLERVELLWQAGQWAETKLSDEARAAALYERVLKLDPDHADAGERVVESLIAAGRWDDAAPVLEMLARKADSGDRLERARRQAQLGRAFQALHRGEKAATHYRSAVEADPDNLEAALGLAAVLMADAKVYDTANGVASDVAKEKWTEVDRRYREVLARHRTGLADGQVAEIWHHLGLCARALGDDRKAENAFRRALEREPAHEATLAALGELAAARGDWRTVVETKRVSVEAAEPTLKLRLLDEIGDIYRHRLKDTPTAVGAYLEGLKLDPSSRTLLHKLLDAYSEGEQWRRAVETLDQLAEGEAQIDRRARYYYTAAVIARDKLGDVDVAVDKFAAALDDDAATPKAFEAIEKLLESKKDYRGLARAYRRQLKRLGDEAEASATVEVWGKLGDIYLDHLGDTNAATEAYQVACDLAPDDLTRREALAELYLEGGEARRGDAIREVQTLLAAAPERVELYKTLSQLYADEHELDKAWCVAQVLVFLGAASDQERALFARYRSAQFQPATRRLTEELWQKSIMHPREERYVGAIFASTLATLAGGSAQLPQAFGLDAKHRLDLDRDARLPAKVVKYATSVLALDPVPMAWIDGAEGLRIANTLAAGDRPRLVPSLLLGSQQLAKTDERELAFEIGKRMAYLRPERFATMAVGSVAKLEHALVAAVTASGKVVHGHEGAAVTATSDEARAWAQQMKAQVPSAMLEQVGEFAHKLEGRLGNGLVSGWHSATDHTANRVGLILSNDVEAAARVIATETAALSGLPVKQRLRELLAYAVSEPYFQVRRHLGVHVKAEVDA